MKVGEKLKVAYIVSIAHGLDAWTYREIDGLENNNTNVSLFPLKFRAGPYMPEAELDIYWFNWITVFLFQPWYFVRDPVKYLTLWFEALKTHSLPYLLVGFDFARQMSKRKIQFIDCVFADHKFFIGFYCKRIINLPLSIAIYGYELKNNTNWVILKQALPYADTIIVNCDYNKQLLAKISGNAIADKAKFIRHFAEVPDKAASTKIKILHVGGIKSQKGHAQLFKAIKSLGELSDNIEVWVAGYPGDINIQELALESGIADKVKIFESIPDQVLELLYQQCDIFYLPSITLRDGVSEGLGFPY